MFERFKRWWRGRILARNPIDNTLWTQTLARLPFLHGLTETDRERLRQCAVLFLHYKSIQGAAGLIVDERMRLMIAAQACILILNLDIDYYLGWSEVIVYPDEFVPTIEYTDEAGVVHRDREPRAGEAWLHGPLILSWADVPPASGRDGVNVVIHEFAHKLDMLNDDANGCPPLHKDMNRAEWSQTFGAAYADFCRRVDADEELPLDPYASENPGEFFAVMSEAFFEIPLIVLTCYPQVYHQLCMFYRQDPAARMETIRQPE